MQRYNVTGMVGNRTTVIDGRLVYMNIAVWDKVEHQVVAFFRTFRQAQRHCKALNAGIVKPTA